ncbi:hypothetical protein TeGR_g3894 [Tetraparma gracilis]|uniref:Uncharacterized protein n=1 Tax=Tetraparma gracilis TaxID=2962635 RepID=A0ABQ6MDA4_9STRA|nr:hypothetical protein TeGR_g3894 [Tetraparma gracilis]
MSEQTLNALLEQLLLPASTSPLARIAQLRAENGYNARLVSTPALLPCAGGRSFAKALTHYRKASRAEFPFVVAALADLFEHVTACVNAAALCDPPLSAKPAPKPKAPPKPRVPPIPSFPSAVKLAVPKPKGVKRLRDDGADPSVPGTSLSYADRVLREEYFENFKKLRSGDQKSQLVPLARGDWDRETVGADSVTYRLKMVYASQRVNRAVVEDVVGGRRRHKERQEKEKKKKKDKRVRVVFEPLLFQVPLALLLKKQAGFNPKPEFNWA